MRVQIKDREPNKKEIGQIISLTKLILREAEKRGIEMSKRKAKRLAVDRLGFVDLSIRADAVREDNSSFNDGLKSADPRFHKAT